MVEPALVGVGVLAASVLVAVLLGLLLGRGAERLFRRGRRDSRADEPEDAEPEDAEPGASAEEARTETGDARAEP